MHRLIRGVALLAAGAWFVPFWMERFALGGGNVLAWSAIGLGAGEFVVGLYQVVTGTAQSPRQEQAGMRALFNSLVALAVVDGPIKDHEVKTIRQTIKDATGV